MAQGVGSVEASAGLAGGGALLLVGLVSGWATGRLGPEGPASSPLFWALLCAPLVGAAGGLWASVRKQRAEARLRKQRNALRDELDRLVQQTRVRAAMFEAAPAAALAVSESGRVTAWNPAAERIFGLRDLKRIKIEELLPDLGALQEDEALPRYSAAGELLGREWRTRGRHADGTVFAVQLERARSEAPRLELVTVREATTLVDEEQRRVREALESEHARVVELARHRAEFLGRVGQQLRSQANLVLTNSDEVTRHLPDLPAAREGAAQMRESAHAMWVIVEKLLNLGMIDDTIQRLTLEPVAVTGLVDELVHTLQPTLRRNRNTLEVKISEQVAILTTDRQKLAHAVRNLLTNAARYTRDGRIVLDVVLEPGRGTDWVAFFVSDTGAGLSPKELDQLFEAFNLPDAASTQEYLAVGTGLALSQHCARQLGGHIAVRSAPGEGSTFTLRVPMTRSGPTGARLLHSEAPRLIL